MSQQSKSSNPESNRIPGEHLTADERLFKPPTIIERRAFVHTDPWRALRILGEFVEGFDELADVRAFRASHDKRYARRIECLQ